MKRVRYILAVFASTAALLTLTSVGAASAQASAMTPGTASSPTTAVQPLSDPPGACTKDELGDWKTDRFGIIHYCTYIDGGYYWIPI